MSGAAFRGELEFLSNFSRWPCTLDGELYPTVENAFQAAKTARPDGRIPFFNCSPAEAKRLGRKIEIRDDWEQIKVQVMRFCLASKFTMTTQLGVDLVKKTPSYLVETNTWHDQIWGDCICPTHFGIPGQNLLGGSLMWLRAYLSGAN